MPLVLGVATLMVPLIQCTFAGAWWWPRRARYLVVYAPRLVAESTMGDCDNCDKAVWQHPNSRRKPSSSAKPPECGRPPTASDAPLGKRWRREGWHPEDGNFQARCVRLTCLSRMLTDGVAGSRLRFETAGGPNGRRSKPSRRSTVLLTLSLALPSDLKPRWSLSQHLLV